MSDTSRVRVYNDNIYPLIENFKGEKIHIPAKKYIEMDFYEAHEYKGQYKPIEVDGAGVHVPSSFKMVRVVLPKDFHLEEKESFICNVCKTKFETQDELNNHLKNAHKEQKFDENRDKTLRKG